MCGSASNMFAEPPQTAVGEVRAQANALLSPESYVRHANRQIDVTLTNYLTICSELLPLPVDVPNFGSPARGHADYLYSAGLWIGGIVGNDTLVSTSFEGWSIGTSELFSPLQKSINYAGQLERIPSLASQSFRMLATDTILSGFPYPNDKLPTRKHLPMDIRIAGKSYAWDSSPADQTVLLDYTITNIGTDSIRDCFIGLYADADIVIKRGYWGEGASDDLVGSLPDIGVGYFIDNDGEPHGGQFIEDSNLTRALAMKFSPGEPELLQTNFNWWMATWWHAITSFGPRRRPVGTEVLRDFKDGGIGTPNGDYNKYYVLSHPEWDYDQVLTRTIAPDDPTWLFPDQSVAAGITIGDDTRGMLSAGPFDLLPDSSIRLFATLFVADSVIYREDMRIFLESFPQYYTQAIDLQQIRNQARVSDSLVEIIKRDIRPVTGLEAPFVSDSSITIEFDPWVLPSVTGYTVEVARIDTGLLPNRGTIPPWLEFGAADRVEQDGKAWRHTLDITRLGPFAQARVSTLTCDGRELTSAPVSFSTSLPPEAPLVTGSLLASIDGGAISVVWEPTEDTMVERYLIYRFASRADYDQAYRPFYDTGQSKHLIEPRSHYLLGGRSYWYYEMKEAGAVGRWQTRFTTTDFAPGDLFAVAAVDRYGVHSALSLPQEVMPIAARSKDVVVVTFLAAGSSLVIRDSLRQFYDRVLSGLSYDLYWYADSLKPTVCAAANATCLQVEQLLAYRLVIFDDGLSDYILSADWNDATNGIRRIIESGGAVAEFGAFSGFQQYGISSKPGWKRVNDTTVRKFFGVDSTYYVGTGWLVNQTTAPFVDSLLGFEAAQGVSVQIPSVHFDTTAYRFHPSVRSFWPSTSPPSAAAFVPTEEAEITHRFVSNTPHTSRVAERPAGVRMRRQGQSSWSFGFHLWYMDSDGARNLVDWMLRPDNAVNCCTGFRGNVNLSADDQVDVDDLSLMVEHLFTTGTPLPCPNEADLVGDQPSHVDISDLVSLIGYLFMRPQYLPRCADN